MNFEKEKKELIKLSEKRNFFFKNTTKRDAELYLNSKIDFKGLSENEIEKLEINLGKKFPLEFREYLLEFGKNCGELFCCGQDIEPEKLTEYQIWAKEIIDDDEIPDFLNEDTLVFNFHQGYVFQYFKKEDNQFPIYEYMEGENKTIKRFDSFREMLRLNIENMNRINEEAQKSDGHFLIVTKNGTQAEWPAKNSGIKPREIGDKFIKEKWSFLNLFNGKN
ncbi:SMI1/KNR4 family protein [Flavivirga aquimarina]|uniref:SMI1/KNR4 family protein n=1 Tax=Flavivirga aquimarina TaxID=2027862 RepID=A0ABT8WDX8_9FLAO|nr:SMI1/KNR4 family protein [Flavivirga aquimarina]MDO5971369.1 SMI1/KNR4 family protein [Flavivirga aquimarina]